MAHDGILHYVAYTISAFQPPYVFLILPGGMLSAMSLLSEMLRISCSGIEWHFSIDIGDSH